MTKIHHQFNPPECPAINTRGVSMTIPDETFTIPQLLNRYAQGLPLNGSQEIFDGEEDEEPLELPDLRTLDLTEIQELRDQALAQKNAAEKEIATRQKAKQDAILEKQIEEKLAAKQAKANRNTHAPAYKDDAENKSKSLKTPPEEN